MKETTDTFTLLHKELNDKVKEEERKRRALSREVCTSVSRIILNGLTAMALVESLCTKKACPLDVVIS